MGYKCPKCSRSFTGSQGLGGHLWYAHRIRGKAAREPRRGEMINPPPLRVVVQVRSGRGMAPRRFEVYTTNPDALIEAIRRALMEHTGGVKT